MSEVTRIEQSPIKRELFYVYIGGAQDVLELKHQTIRFFGLKAGDKLNDKKLKVLLEHDSYERAKDVAFRFLSRGPKTEFEVFRHLRKKGFDEKTSLRVIALCLEKGLLNDYKYAEAYVEEFLRLKRGGRYKIWKKLMEKGISRKIIQKVLRKGLTDDKQMELALELAEKKLKLVKNKKGKKAKVFKYLIQKGFSRNVAYKAVKSIT